MTASGHATPVVVVEGTSTAEAVELIAAQLAAAGIAGAEVDARWIVQEITGRDPRTGPASMLTGSEIPALRDAVVRRCRREPLQLVLGRAAFLEHTVRCAPGVFVPRPETEVTALVACDVARQVARPGRQTVIVEPCTGSGVIACALSARLGSAHVVATDVDAAAVDLARENLGAVVADTAEVRVLHGDLLAPLDRGLRGRVDLIVSNPPYLPESDRWTWDPEVRDHDPHGALVGGPDGHEVVRRLLREAPGWLRATGAVVVEFDTRRRDELVAEALGIGYARVEVVDDLAGRPRVLVARDVFEAGVSGGS